MWYHLFLRIEIEGPHDVRAYQGKVSNFLRTAEAFLQQRGFNDAEVGGLGEVFERTPYGVDPWVELRPRTSLLSQAFFYVFHDYQYTNPAGTQNAFVQLYNPTFRQEVRDPRVAQQLTVVFQQRGFQNLTPLTLQNLAPADTRVAYAVEDGEEL